MTRVFEQGKRENLNEKKRLNKLQNRLHTLRNNKVTAVRNGGKRKTRKN